VVWDPPAPDILVITMSDLLVDYAALDYSRTTLASLKSELDTIQDRADMSRDVLSHPSVQSAMREFGGNMDYNRKKLSERLEECGRLVESTIETFTDADTKLASEIRKSGQPA
jgi:hypothetical protein